MISRTVLVAVLSLWASVASAQEREWRFETGENEAFLTFGVPETDDIGLSFWCTPRSGEIKLFLPEVGGDAKPGADVKLRIKAGSRDATYDANTSTNEESGGVSAESRFRSGDPIFTDLQKADRFSLSVGGETWNFPLDNADMLALVDACAKP